MKHEYTTGVPTVYLYYCVCCGRLMRSGGRTDASKYSYCEDCFESIELENQHLDDGHPEPVAGCPLCVTPQEATD